MNSYRLGYWIIAGAILTQGDVALAANHAIQIGDRVAVKEDADLKMGQQVLAVMKKNMRLRVYEIKDSKLLTKVRFEGKLLTGWVSLEKVTLPSISSNQPADEKWDELLWGLRSRNAGLRSGCVQELGRLGKPEALPYLLELVNDPQVKLGLPDALGRIGDRRAVEPLIAILDKEGNSITGERAALALGQLKDPRAVPPLIQALARNNWAAAVALGDLGDSRAVDALIAGMEPVPGFRGDFSEKLRAESARALGRIRDPQAIPALIKKLDSFEDPLRKNAAIALGELGGSKTREALASAWEKSPYETEFIFALSKLRDPRAAKLALRQIERGGVVAGIGRVIGTVGTAEQVPGLIKLLNSSKFVNERVEMAVALALLNTPEAKKPLQLAIKQMVQEQLEFYQRDRKFEPLKEHYQAYRDLGQYVIPPILEIVDSLPQDLENCLDIKMVECMLMGAGDIATETTIEMLKSEKPVTRYIAAKVLENTLDPIAVEPLLSALKQETTESDPKGTVRSTLIYALGKIGDVRAVPVLLNILTGPEKELHSCAASNLMSFENPGTVDIWTAQLRNPKVRYDAAIMLGKAKDPKAVAPLLQILRDCTPIHKRQVVWALGNIGSPKAVEPLFELLKDDTQADYVLGETARALQKIGDPRLVPFLTKNLTREKLADRSARILIGTGWKPTTMEERIHFAVIDRNGFYLRNYWDETKKVLLNDVVSKQGHAIRFAVNAFVGIGNEEIIPNLQEILEKNGDKEMAEAYLNCGHAELRTCAQTWAAKHGYRIIGGKGSNVRWKSF